MRNLTFSGLLLSLVACGGGPEITETPCDEAWRAELPASRYLAAAATGADPQGAADAARARVAAQVASQIEASLEVENSETDGIGRSSVREVVRTKARFDRAELIEVRPLEACEGTAHRAVAALDRAEAAEVLRPQWQAAHDRLARAVEQARAAGLKDATAFTTAWASAHSAFVDAEAAAVPLAIIAGAPPEQARDRAAFRALGDQAAQVRAAHPVTLALGGLPAELRDPVGQALLRGLGALGLTGRPGAGCEIGLQLTPKADLSCGRGPLGPRCALRLSGALARCSGEAVAPLDLGGPPLAAVHPRSEDVARQRVIEKAGEADLSATLGSALSPVLPLEAR